MTAVRRPLGTTDDSTPGAFLLDFHVPEWMERGLCAQTDPEAFFPDTGGSVRAAKQICAACDVRAECLAYALEHDVRAGVWGGQSEFDRRKARAAARKERGAA